MAVLKATDTPSPRPASERRRDELQDRTNYRWKKDEVLSVSGRIHGENVETLREVILREQDRLPLDLMEVILVDREAVKQFAVSEALEFLHLA
jgi:hypothetical protein